MWADMVGMGGGMVRDNGRGFLYRRTVLPITGWTPPSDRRTRRSETIESVPTELSPGRDASPARSWRLMWARARSRVT